jgi:hypothetical protein
LVYGGRLRRSFRVQAPRQARKIDDHALVRAGADLLNIVRRTNGKLDPSTIDVRHLGLADYPQPDGCWRRGSRRARPRPGRIAPVRQLIVPPNITLVALPPKCPALNPVENIWQFIRGNWLSNRIFRSDDDILEHCCFAWNKLVDQPSTIMSQRKTGCLHHQAEEEGSQSHGRDARGPDQQEPAGAAQPFVSGVRRRRRQ